jgi:hypothetical protein
MINYKKINLECLDSLYSYIVNEIKDLLSTTDQLVITSNVVTLPDELLKVVNDELNSYNISSIDYCRIYLWPKGSVQTIHVDGFDKVLHCAINIPLYGGENSKFQWFDGKFKLSSVNLRHTNQKAYYINWESIPYITESIEIKDGCYLIRIDQPHQAIASSDSDRWIFTMRFKDNPTFEELYDKLPASNV